MRSIREIVFKVNADVPVSHFRLCTNGFNPCTDMYIIPIKGFTDWLTREPKISKEGWRRYTTYEELQQFRTCQIEDETNPPGLEHKNNVISTEIPVF